MKVLRLKNVFSVRDGRVCHSGSGVRWEDLEKKNRTGALLVGSRNLHDLAAKGSRCFKKTLAHSIEKWDDKTMEPKESGWSVDDVIEHVRKKNHVELVGPSDKGANENASDEESESEETIGVGDAIDKEKNVGAEVIGDDVDGDDVVASAVGKDKGANDDDDHNDDSPSSKSSSESDNDEITDDWMFTSLHVLMLWGPFVEP